MNIFQKRLKKHNKVKLGNYLFYGIPNNDEGREFMRLFRKFVNPKFTFRRHYRMLGKWKHSVLASEGDSFVVYV